MANDIQHDERVCSTLRFARQCCLPSHSHPKELTVTDRRHANNRPVNCSQISRPPQMVVIDCQGVVGLVGIPPIVSSSNTDAKIGTCVPQTGHPVTDHDHDKVELEYPSGRLIETDLEIGEGTFHATSVSEYLWQSQ